MGDENQTEVKKSAPVKVFALIAIGIICILGG